MRGRPPGSRFRLGHALALGGFVHALVACGNAETTSLPRIEPAVQHPASLPPPDVQARLEQKYRDAPPVTLNPTLGTSVTGAPNVLVTSVRDGMIQVCLDFERGATVIEYGPQGQLRMTHADGTRRTGMRFEMQLDPQLAAFQMGNGEPVRFFRTALSSGQAAEVFSEPDGGRPIMRCFRQIHDEFMWIDSDLMRVMPLLLGHWTCQGPLGAVSLADGGRFASTAVASGQAFVWRDRTRAAFLSVLSTSKGPARGFDGGVEFALDLSGLEQGRLVYRGAGASSMNACGKTSS